MPCCETSGPMFCAMLTTTRSLARKREPLSWNAIRFPRKCEDETARELGRHGEIDVWSANKGGEATQAGERLPPQCHLNQGRLPLSSVHLHCIITVGLCQTDEIRLSLPRWRASSTLLFAWQCGIQSISWT